MTLEMIFWAIPEMRAMRMRVRFWHNLETSQMNQRNEMTDTLQLPRLNLNKGQEKEVICHLWETILPHPPKENLFKGLER